MFIPKRKRQVNYKEMKKILIDVKKSCKEIFDREKEDGEYFMSNAYTWINRRNRTLNVAYVTYIEEKNEVGPITYYLYLDGKEDYVSKLEGTASYAILRRYYKEEQWTGEYVGSAKQLLYKNEKPLYKDGYEGRRPCYSYDMNSAFAWAMTLPMPDITSIRRNARIGNGEVGFIYKTGDDLEPCIDVGEYCDFVCKLMDSPYKKFVETWYGKKKNALNSEDKIDAKTVLCHSVGCLQYHNPFIRAMIVGMCNMYIESLIDDNTVYANTDSIVSVVRREDIEENLGTDVGQFKLERNGELFAFAKDTMNYQWNLEFPKAKGYLKSKYRQFAKDNGRAFDILIDNVDEVDPDIYEFNFKRHTLRKKV